jgi:hypothetical protein
VTPWFLQSTCLAIILSTSVDVPLIVAQHIVSLASECFGACFYSAVSPLSMQLTGNGVWGNSDSVGVTRQNIVLFGSHCHTLTVEAISRGGTIACARQSSNHSMIMRQLTYLVFSLHSGCHWTLP